MALSEKILSSQVLIPCLVKAVQTKLFNLWEDARPLSPFHPWTAVFFQSSPRILSFDIYHSHMVNFIQLELKKCNSL